MSASWEAQKALYTQLKNDATFMNLIGSRLYDEPVTNNVYPYVMVGDTIEVPDNDLSHNGYDTSITFTIKTKPAGLGFYQGKQIVEEMNRILNMKIFDMTGFTMIICRFDNMITDRDGDIRTISVRYQVLSDTSTIIKYV